MRRASSLRFLKARSEAAVWPLRPREELILDQSIFVAAERLRSRRGGRLVLGFRQAMKGNRRDTYPNSHDCGVGGQLMSSDVPVREVYKDEVDIYIGPKEFRAEHVMYLS